MDQDRRLRSETTAPTYVKAGEPIEEATTLYAVYAEQSGEGGEPQSTTYTFTSKAWADATNSQDQERMYGRR